LYHSFTITSLLKQPNKMKKYYNATLFTLLSLLLNFNLYGQIEINLQSRICLGANADLIIEDVIWNADVSDLVFELEALPIPSPGESLPTTLNEAPIPESFHVVVLSSMGYFQHGFSYTFDVLVAPTAKPVVFVYQTHPAYPLIPIINDEGYIEGMNMYYNPGIAGIASTAAVMGRQRDDDRLFDTRIDIITTNRIGQDINGTICNLEDATYSFHRFGNKEAQNITTSQSLNIYPNPAKNNLFVEKNDIDIQKVELLTLQGQVQHQVSIRHDVDKIQVNTSSLQAGVYLLKLDTDNETIIEKIIIQ